MASDLFYVSSQDTQYTYQDLLRLLACTDRIKKFCYAHSTYEVFTSIILSLIHNTEITLLDSDFSELELTNMGVVTSALNDTTDVKPIFYSDLSDLLHAIRSAGKWQIHLFTSGTTGIPKKIKHNLASISRSVRIAEKHKQSTWGFAYNPTHMAGIQVFFQALLNGNSIIDIFKLDRSTVFSRIEKYKITNISATPTYYRMLLPMDKTYQSIQRITSGGERFDPDLIEALQQGFPKAHFRNIYASTEAGAILESKSDVFIITDPALCKIEAGTLWIHKSVVGGFQLSGDWYDTGDLVSVLDSEPTHFRFVSRANEMINVGGYKVNPLEVESAINHHHGVIQSRVYGKQNRILGNVLIADVVTSEPISEKELRNHLSGLLQPHKIPRLINFVDEIITTRTGKVQRI